MSARSRLEAYVVYESDADQPEFAARLAAFRAEVLAEGLTGSEHTFLTFALGLAADAMASRGNEFTVEDDAALASLRAMATPAPTPVESAGDETGEGCACGPQMRCAKGHCSRHDMCQDCGNCCSCKCATGGAA